MNKISPSNSTTSTFYQGPSSLQALKSLLLEEKYKESSLFLITDKNCKKFCLPILFKEIGMLAKASIMEINDNEEDKSIQSCIEIWEWLTKNCADRNALVINLGGGMIGDLGGFAASTFKRGMDFINVPTTLLSQVDAAIGGKTAVNFMGHKNLVGVFQDPKAVFNYPGFLETLPERQILSGFAEMIKHALIADADYWKKITETDPRNVDDVAKLVERSIEIKGAIVKQDPKEKGVRKLLNFGHTVGHAIESCALEEGRPLLHGEAIAVGMICESYLSYRVGKLDHAVLDEICSYIFNTFPTFEMGSDCYHRLIQLMRNDKKNNGKQINFSLINSIGQGVYDQSVESDFIVKSFQFYHEKISLIPKET